MTFHYQLLEFPSKLKVKNAKPSLLGSQSTNPEFLLFAGHCLEQHVWGYQQMFVVPLHIELIKIMLN